MGTKLLAWGGTSELAGLQGEAAGLSAGEFGVFCGGAGLDRGG